jgi:glycosyltransferase involved in cell wall biosynthesis
LKDSLFDRKLVALFVGGGELLSELQRQASRLPNLISVFPGFLNLDEIPAAYAASDVLVHTAVGEPFGLVVLEGAHAGLPLLVTRETGAAGFSDVAREGENALLFDVGDIELLSKHLDRLVTEPELKTRLGAASLCISDELGAGWLPAFVSAIKRVCENHDSVLRSRRSLSV